MKNSCPFCKSEKTSYKRKITSPYNEKNYSLFDCTTCGLTFFTPLIFEDIYEPSVNGSYDHRHKGIPKINAPSDKAARSIKFSLKDKTILDVGASNCVNFLSLKKYHNITPEQYYALELDNKALRIGKEIGVKNIIHHYFDKNILKKINRTFDLVIATEVLEHQVNPKEFIDTAFKVLKKNGILVLTIPNKKRFFLKYREQPGDVPPHHFLRFDKAFFIKNFKKEIVHVEEFHNRQTTFKETSKSVAKKIFKNQKLWVLASPLTVILRIIQVVDIIKGDKLLVIMKKG